MDSFEEYMNTYEITPMPEGWRAVRGEQVTPCQAAPVHLRAVKNSWAQLNIAIKAPQKCLVQLEPRVAFPHRAPLDKTSVLRAALMLDGFEGQLCFAGMVQDDDDVPKADVVIPGGCHPVQPYQINQILAIIKIPSGIPAGVYHGYVRIYLHTMLYDERVARDIPFELRVEDITLPSGQDRAFYLNLWQHISNMARHLEVPAMTDQHIEAMRPFAKTLGELGCRAATVVLSDAAWAGQYCYQEQDQPSDLYEYNFVRVTRDAQGTFHYDFSFADRYIAMMAEYGMDDIMFCGLHGAWFDEAAGFGRMVEGWHDAVRVSYTDETDGALRFMRRRDEFEGYVRAVYAWVMREGLLGRCCLMGDEIDLGRAGEGWEDTIGTIRRLMPDIRMDWDNGIESMQSELFRHERVDIYTPSIDSCAAASPEQMHAARARIEPGGKFLWSTCCCPHVLNSFLCCNLNEVRLHGLITEKLGLDGFLRWNYTVWPNDPRTSLVFGRGGWPAGDTCFVYPGKGGQCFLSLRALALKRGIEEYELAQKVKRLPNGEATIARALNRVLREKDLQKWDFNDVFARETYFSVDTQDYESARALLLDALTKEASL